VRLRFTDAARRRVLTMIAGLRGLGRRAAGDEGFTLTELLVAMSISLVVIGAGVMMFTAAIQSQPKANDRLAKVRSARTTSELIVRELRQGWSTPVATSSQLSILTYVHRATCGGVYAGTSIPCRVTYTCTAGACSRVEAQPDGTGPGQAKQVVSGLSNATVFTYTTGAAGSRWIGITMRFPGENGDDAITVEDGATLRNPGASS
jgi:prepilin-type N-terminal cleavage/methylation domain-containing protein